jgi:hypothetical protein
MSRVMTFSRVYPVHHPRKGQETFFVEKIWRSNAFNGKDTMQYLHVTSDVNLEDYARIDPKHHTVRAGNRWKVGDKFSPRVWTGKPYASKMMTIGPDIEIKKIWRFEMYISGDHKCFTINHNKVDNFDDLNFLSKNDGLDMIAFAAWFKKPFVGQIICWDENLEYC